MPIKRGHVAPQNTYIVTLIRNFDPQCNNFLAANALLHTKPIIYSSDSLCDLFGFTKAQMMLKSSNLNFLCGTTTTIESLEALGQSLRQSHETELNACLHAKNGTPIACKISVTPVRDESGQLPLYLLFFHVEENPASSRSLTKRTSLKPRLNLKSLKKVKEIGDSLKTSYQAARQTLTRASEDFPRHIERECDRLSNLSTEIFKNSTSEQTIDSPQCSHLFFADNHQVDRDVSHVSSEVSFRTLNPSFNHSSYRRRPATWCRTRSSSDAQRIEPHRPASAHLRGLQHNDSIMADSEALRLVLSCHQEPTKTSVSEKFAQFLSMDEDLRVEHRFQSPHMHKFTIKHYSVFKAIWDWIILALIIYTAIATPFVTVFLTNYGNKYANMLPSRNRSTTYLNSTYYSVESFSLSRTVDIMVDVMFFVDIFINFRTTYVNKNDEVVSHPRRIATHYVKGWFFIDLVAAIPFDLIFFQSARDQHTTLTSLLKAARLLRLVGIVRKLDRYSEYGASILLLLTALFALIAHWLACIWYAIGNAEHQYRESKIGWLATLAEQTNQSYRPGDPQSGPDMKTKYITALYFTFSSLTSIGFGNVSPNTNAEKVFSIIVMLVGSLMYASIFGNVGALIQRLYSGTARYHAQMLRIKEFIRFHQIPSPLRQRLEEYSTQVWEHTNGIDMTMVQYSFPESLQSDICLYVYRDILSGSSAFKCLNDGCLRNLSLRIRSTHMPPSDTLIHTGDLLTAVYYVVKGSLEVVTTDDQLVGVLNPGDFFGGLPTLVTCRHSHVSTHPCCHLPPSSGHPPSITAMGSTASPPKSRFAVRALTYADIQFIDRHELADLCLVYPELCTRLLDRFELTIPLVSPGKQSFTKHQSNTHWYNGRFLLEQFLSVNATWNTVKPALLSTLTPLVNRHAVSMDEDYFASNLPVWELERLQRLFEHGTLSPDAFVDDSPNGLEEVSTQPEHHSSRVTTGANRSVHSLRVDRRSPVNRSSDNRTLYHLVTRFDQLEKQIQRLDSRVSSTISTILAHLQLAVGDQHPTTSGSST